MPVIAKWLLRRIYSWSLQEGYLGDIEEEYINRLSRYGKLRAANWMLWQTIKSVPGALKFSITWSLIMFFSYTKIAWRNLKRHKGYSFINIMGLALGLACCFIILLFIINTYGYDRYNENSDRIYRIAIKGSINDKIINVPLLNQPVGPTIKREFPEVINFVRFAPSAPVLVEDVETLRQSTEPGFAYADSSVFSVFSFELIKGNPVTALNRPYTVVIDEEVAEKMFPGMDPVGKTLRVRDQLDLTVTGVMEKIPENSHFKPRILASYETLRILDPERFEIWFSFNWYTYLLLAEDADPKSIEQKFPALVDKYMGEELETFGFTVEMYLQPLTSIYLRSNLQAEIGETFDIKYIYIFAAIAVFILLIASINFMNLSTARSVNRAKEVGMRKVFGANRENLIRQFLGESVLLSIAAYFVSLILLKLFLPFFNSIAGRELSISFISDIHILLVFLFIAILLGILSGCYPSFFLSAFKPVKVLRGDLKKGAKSPLMRSILVITQFTISITLIICTLVVGSQLLYIQKKNLGFDKEQIVVISTKNINSERQLDLLKSEMLNIEGVSNITGVSSLPGYTLSTDGFIPEGYTLDQSWAVTYMTADISFLETLKIDVVDGRGFSYDYVTDTSSAIMINETAAKELGWDQPVGRKISAIPVTHPDDSRHYTVIGVFKDFHFRPLREPVEPLFIYYGPNQFTNLLVRLSGNNIPAALERIKTKWNEIIGTKEVDFFFLDESINRLYRSEQNLGELFQIFTLLSIVIGCLGLFGLVSYVAEQRTKEIGIRKTLGASVPNIMFLISKDFAGLISIATVLAWPAAWFLMQRWLENFAYKTDIGITPFLIATIGAIIIAQLSVSYRSIKAALKDPVESLRYE